MKLTKYQSLIVKYFEAEYGRPICEVLQYFRDMPLRFEDIAELAGCSDNTLRKICKCVGFNNEGPVILLREGIHSPNATDFLKSFTTIEDAVIHCRHKLKLTVKGTVKKLGISRSTIARNTPDWLKYTFNFTGKRKRRDYSPSEEHPWKKFKV